MQKYTKVYLNYFGFSIADFVPCEMCGSRSTEIHHILNRSHRKDLENNIINLMAVCRPCHIEYGDKKQHIEYLQEVHSNKISRITKD